MSEVQQKSKCLLATRGRLHIKIQTSQERLQVFVHEAKLLKALNVNSKFSSVFVKVTVIPNDDSRIVNETKAVSRSSHVVFEEPLTYHILPGDGRKRLYVEVLSKDESRGLVELIGCLSFGMKHLIEKTMKKPVDGWFYLLSESIGRRKHIQTPVSMRPTNYDKSCFSLPTSIENDTWNQNFSLYSHILQHKIEIQKNSSDFGFTLTASCPVRVGKVTPNSSAAQSGLAPGDFIVCVNSRDVSRTNAMNVARLINAADSVLILDIYRFNASRHQQHSRLENVETENFVLPFQDGMSVYNLDFGHRTVKRRKITHVETFLLQTESTIETAYNKVFVQNHETVYQEIDDVIRPCSVTKQFSQSENIFYEKGSLSILPDSGVSSAGVSSVSELDNGFFDEPDVLQDETIWKPSSINGSFPLFSPIRGSIHNHNNIEQLQNSKFSCRDESPSSRSNHQCNEAFLINDQSGHDETIIFDQHFEDPIEDVCDSQIHLFISCEEKYVSSLLNGAQRFSRPLRHCILSPQHHAALFQNIEKLMVLSEFNLKGLRETCFCNAKNNPERPVWEMIINLFSLKLKLLLGAYGQYMTGLSSSLRVLQDLYACQPFVQFIKETNADSELTIEEFLRLPVEHLQELVLLFRVLSRNSTSFNEELEKITKTMTETLLKQSFEKENIQSQSDIFDKTEKTVQTVSSRKKEKGKNIAPFKENINPQGYFGEIQRKPINSHLQFDGCITKR